MRSVRRHGLPEATLNRDWVIEQLREAHEELSRTIAEIEASPDYDVGEFFVAIQHIYHHLNTAWNSRDETAASVAALTDDKFYEWRRFPHDIYWGR